MNSNKKSGNRFEAELCEILAKYGFWAHNLAQNQAGQPADVIAAANGDVYLIDCKACSGNTFSKRRIEENQRTAMELWSTCGNGSGWFAVKFENFDEIYMVSLKVLDETQCISLGREWFKTSTFTLHEWIGV